MKLVIDIPEKYLNSNIIDVTLITGANNTITDVNVEDKYAEFQVLPKGHGRLIAEPTESDISNTVGGNNDFAECIRDSVKAVFDNATTIIEADEQDEA